MKTFGSLSELLKIASGKKIYIEVSENACIFVQKSALKDVSKSLSRRNLKFCGNINEIADWYIQIKLV